MKSSPTCLIVDDSKVVRMVARRILEDLNFDILEAEDGRVAMNICQEAFPDIVLLDWNMPVMDGMEFLRSLRGLEGGDKPIVIFCTTENDMTHISEAISAGADEYIMKPFDRAIIEAKLAQVGML